ncbi:MAG: hypothetical protein U0528_06925 [Anaerolineae bacterium]
MLKAERILLLAHNLFRSLDSHIDILVFASVSSTTICGYEVRTPLLKLHALLTDDILPLPRHIENCHRSISQ